MGRDFASHSPVPFTDRIRKVRFPHIRGNGKMATPSLYHLSEVVSLGIWLVLEPTTPTKSSCFSFLSYSCPSSKRKDLEFRRGAAHSAFLSETVMKMDRTISGNINLLYLFVE